MTRLARRRQAGAFSMARKASASFLAHPPQVVLRDRENLLSSVSMANVPPIPDDLEACKAIIVEQAEVITKLHQTVQEQELTINELLQRAYRNRSERYQEDPTQLMFDFGDTPEVADAAEGLAEAVAEAEVTVAEHKRRRRKPRKPRNEALPEHLERREVKLPDPEEVRNEPDTWKFIGFGRQETLMFERPKLWVRVTLIPKYICKNEPEKGVVESPRPVGLVEGNRYDTSVASEIITGKHGFHLPIYRQQDYFAGSGWTPARSTLLNILVASATVIRPFIRYLRGEVIASGLLGTDDTRVTLLLPPEIPQAREGDPKSQRIHEVFTAARAKGAKSISGRMWAYRSLTVPINVFDFTVSRHRDGPDEFLVASDFTGTMLADCYSGYQGITVRSDARIVRAACNAHARRKIFDARTNEPLLASRFLAIYQELYDIETRGKMLSYSERELLRASEARPIWGRMRELLDSEAVSHLLPKEKFTDALAYLRNHWDALQVYLGDGRLPMDNNETEQLMKQVATGRKNWLFIGSVEAGERAAGFLTLVSSALRNDLDVHAYVKNVLDRLLAGETNYATLRPDRWAKEHPEHIRAYRQEERRDRYAAAQTRRAARRHPAPA